MARKKETTPAKRMFSVRVDCELVDAARRVAYGTPGMTLASLPEDALRREVKRLEQKRGKPFPLAPVSLPTGRPRKGG